MKDTEVHFIEPMEYPAEFERLQEIQNQTNEMLNVPFFEFLVSQFDRRQRYLKGLQGLMKTLSEPLLGQAIDLFRKQYPEYDTDEARERRKKSPGS